MKAYWPDLNKYCTAMFLLLFFRRTRRLVELRSKDSPTSPRWLVGLRLMKATEECIKKQLCLLSSWFSTPISRKNKSRWPWSQGNVFQIPPLHFYLPEKIVVEREQQIQFPFIQFILGVWTVIWHQLHYQKTNPTFQESLHLKDISKMRGVEDVFQGGTEYFWTYFPPCF